MLTAAPVEGQYPTKLDSIASSRCDESALPSLLMPSGSGRALPSDRPGLPRNGWFGSSSPALSFECLGRCSATLRRCLSAIAFTRSRIFAFSLLSGFLGHRSARWRRQLHPRPPRLGKTDRNRLLGRTCPMVPLTDVVHFFAHQLSRLS